MAMNVLLEDLCQRESLSFLHFLKAKFWNILSSPTVECFVISSLWCLFLHNFQPDRKTQDLLFHRIAENYIRILNEDVSSRSSRAFLQWWTVLCPG
ncbi:protein FAM227B-like [Electrophorus electricus]|uniref:protein FAM227B-like n=1 Tax=Electrophorus electricus TaxID=8005 RepID=UPI0015D04FFC|nr:protein FAM227B-like [Electrophorus electricus]